MTERLVLQSHHSFEDQLTAAIEADDPRQKGQVCISVAEEQAVDSYNSMFTCSIHLTSDKARQLRDRLARNTA